MGKLIGLVDLIQVAVDKGATSVEGVHRSIANKPYELLKTVVPCGQIVGGIQAMQNHIIGGVYDVIRAVNNGLSNTTKVALGQFEKTDTADLQ